MILLQAPTHDLYLHQSRDWQGIPRYVRLYGLDIHTFNERADAIRDFAACLDHAEECETGTRPIYGPQEGQQ